MNSIGVSILIAAITVAADPPDPKVSVDPKNFVDYEKILNDRLSKGITPETNANVLIVKALGPKPEGRDGLSTEYFKRLGIDPLPEKGEYFIGPSEFARERLKLAQSELSAFWSQQGEASKRPWTAKEYPRLASWLAANEKPLALVIEGTKRPRYYDPVIVHRTEKGPGMLMSALIPTVQKSREIAAALTARAMLRTAEGKYDEAWQDLLACHRLGRHVGHATLIHALVGIAVDAVAARTDLAYLANAKLTPEQIRTRLKDLQKLPPVPPMADTLDTGERISYFDSLQHIRLGDDDTTPEEKKDLAMIDWGPAIKDGEAMYDRMVAAARLETRAARQKAFDRIEADLEVLMKAARKGPGPLELLQGPGKAAGRRISSVLNGLLAPAVRKVVDAHDRAEQTERNLHLAFALAAYRGDTGRYPAKLDELAPKYLDKVPDDLFAAKPLVYKPTEKGYLLYSVGVDGKDDGGRTPEDDPPGDDLAVQMPLPPRKEKK